MAKSSVEPEPEREEQPDPEPEPEWLPEEQPEEQPEEPAIEVPAAEVATLRAHVAFEDWGGGDVREVALTSRVAGLISLGLLERVDGEDQGTAGA